MIAEMSEKAAHIITARQKKGALASVKKPKVPKTVLFNNDINFWPCLDETQSETFVKLIETHEGFEDGLLIGLESTLRNLKKPNHVQMLVIANEISPKFFGKHLIATALNQNRNMKIIIVPKLKNVTKSLLKVPTIVFSVMSSIKLQSIDDFYARLSSHDELLKHYCAIKDASNVTIKKKKKKKICDESSQAKVCLLVKSSTSSRSFVPTSTEEATPAQDSAPVDVNMGTSDYIALSKYNSSSDFLASSSATPLYRPLKFIKVDGNPNRKKK